MRTTEREADHHSVLGKAFAILGALETESRFLTLAELTAVTGLPKSTIHRFLKVLIEAGWVEVKDGRYELGLRIFELAKSVSLQRHFREAALPFMTDLYEVTHEVIHLAIARADHVVYIEKISGHSRIAMGSRVGGTMPLHATGVGKALLAFSERPLLEEALRHPLQRLTAYTITVPKVLLSELKRIRKEGVAFDREEAKIGINCVAAPVFDQHGVALAAVSVTGPVGRLDPDRFASAVRTAARGISRTVANDQAVPVIS